MGEPKPFASLSSGLLARKGGASPAMRRAPLGSGPAPMGANGYDDLGWNDMGYDVDPARPHDVAPRVDIKSLLTGSMPAHNFEAEHAVEASEVEPVPIAPPPPTALPVTSMPWADVPSPDVPQAKPEIVRQQEVLQARVEQDAPVAAPAFEPVLAQPAALPAKAVRRASAPRAVAADGRARDKAAFTLRLDAERHLRLRLASAIYNRSAQQILIDVLDDYLSALPEIDAMASRLPTSPAHRATTLAPFGDDQ